MPTTRPARIAFGVEPLEVRDNPSGVFDTTFSGDGKAVYTATGLEQAAAVALQRDGRVVTVGVAQPAGENDFLVTRSLADGTLDPTFDGDGRFTFNTGASEAASDVTVQPDGRIVVVGSTLAGSSFLILRLTANGAPDTTFDADGLVTVDLGVAGVQATAVVVQPDNKIVVAGVGPNSDAALVRLNPNGTLDATFDTDGKFQAVLPDEQAPFDLALQPDGKFVLAGGNTAGSSKNMFAMRVNANGGLDTTFDADGLVTVDGGGDETAYALALQPDGRVVLAGESFIASARKFIAARLTANGAPDTTFDADGQVTLDFGPQSAIDVCKAVAVHAGRIILAGYTFSGVNFYDWGVMRLTDSGALDTTFGVGGKLSINLGGFDQSAAMTVDRQGRIVVAGFTSPAGDTDLAIVRLIGSTSALAGRSGTTGNWAVATSTGTAFTTNFSYATWNEAAGWQDVSGGDFNGDGLADVAGRTSNGQWWVGLNTGSTFAVSQWTAWNEAAGWKDVRVADFDSDGRTDIAARTSNGQWWVARSTGTAFANTQWATWNEAAGWKDVNTGDFNGDGRPDLAGRTSNGQWWVSLSSGTNFFTVSFGAWNEAGGWRDVRVGDFDRDGKADVAGRTSTGQWWVGRSTGGTFTNTQWVAWNEAGGWRDVSVGDFNGDGKADIAGRTSTGQWWVAVSSGTAFANTQWVAWNEAANWKDIRVGDFNGDGKADIAGRGSGQWWVNVSNGTAFATSLWATWNETSNWKDVSAGPFVG
jgi:uncharacterized delta-60 repeat protein